MNERRSAGTNCILVDLEDSLADWGRVHEVLIGALKMRTEAGTRLGVVRFRRSIAEIVAHAPEDVKPGDIKHVGFVWNIQEKEEILGGREPGKLVKHSHIESP